MHSKGRILIVEDDPSVLSILSENFETGFPEVVTAGNGAEALMKFRPYDYDLVISDIRMPEMDGFSLLEKIRKMDAEVPIFMMTGLLNNETASTALQKGADGLIPKPFHFEQLRTRLSDFFINRRQKENRDLWRGILWGSAVSIAFWIITGITLFFFLK
ncbi:MAG TPA: response regulator [Syntrophales bacterium]|nr:response regulator [Syntrophales bacterium]HOX94930.1 response regulator [Syntrophales bacterium]HPI58328.1 response regulator [Syntrophales bacterium]HPN26146.1 response regulator [Syntrophales bacterium]HQM30523.1 response regulator [Syntrophales bacterium]